MRSAQTLGAHLHMPATFIGAQLHENSCSITYQHNGQTHTCETTVLVNAAGPWANRVLGHITPAPTQLVVDLVQGTHLVVAGNITHGIYYVEAPQDQRAVFVMPWQGNTLVGTTETVYKDDPVRSLLPLPQQQEQDYLIQTLAHYFPAYRNQPVILSAFAGLRVLPVGEGKAFSRPRETILHVDRQERPRLLTVYGGKLTAYRLTATRVIQRLTSTLPSRTARADTRALILSA